MEQINCHRLEVSVEATNQIIALGIVVETTRDVAPGGAICAGNRLRRLGWRLFGTPGRQPTGIGIGIGIGTGVVLTPALDWRPLQVGHLWCW